MQVFHELLQQIFEHYIQRERTKDRIREAFKAHFVVGPMKGKKVPRAYVFATLCEEMREPPGIKIKGLITSTLYEMGVKVQVSMGAYYFRGLEPKPC